MKGCERETKIQMLIEASESTRMHRNIRHMYSGYAFRPHVIHRSRSIFILSFREAKGDRENKRSGIRRSAIGNT